MAKVRRVVSTVLLTCTCLNLALQQRQSVFNVQMIAPLGFLQVTQHRRHVFAREQIFIWALQAIAFPVQQELTALRRTG